ncbi:MAG TPA: ankyrin repeat domain-containing protein [Verrucomicrobiae bacterium]|nr:ankyrin repeat domain-containing protein [Verrucomicrobiae bacterium]
MKIKMWAIAVILALAIPARGATNNLTSLLQKGLFEEEANRNLDSAITNYQSLAAQFDKDRKVAATAVFRLGECYRKLGQTNEAAAQYQRIVREFSDQPALVTLSRQNLAGMGVAQSGGALPDNIMMQAATAAQNEADLLKSQLNRLKSLPPQQLRTVVQQSYSNPVLTKLFEDLADAEQQLATLGENFTSDSPTYKGQQDKIDAINKQIDQQINGVLLGLSIKQKAAEERARALRGQAGNSQLAEANQFAEPAPVTDDEEKEIRRIQAMIQNSPDLINAPKGDEGTPLFQAAGKGWLRVATFLLDHGASVNIPAGSNGKIWDHWTALMEAANNGHKTMVELLLGRGADVNAKDNRGQTALSLAVDRGFTAVITVLLNHGADVNARSSEENGGRTPLYRAAAAGNIEVMKLLITRGADVNAKSRGGVTPLWAAAGGGHLDAIKTLLAAKADPNLADDSGLTPLGKASQGGEMEIAKALLAAKANVNAQDKDGETPLFLAAKFGKGDVAEMLLDAGADPNLVFTGGNANWSPLDFAVVAGNESLTRKLLEHGADPNHVASPRPVSIDGNVYNTDSVGPVLMTAAYNKNNPALVKILLEHGANPNVRFSDQLQTPLLLNICNTPEVLKLFLEHKANPNIANTNGYTALHSAAERGLTNAIALLVNHGANVNVQAKDGSTPLFVAAWFAQSNAVAELLAFKADPNIKTDSEDSPLIRAARENQNDIVKILLSGGADPNIRGQQGITPLHWAVYESNKDIVSELLAHKANPNVRNNAGNTPLDLAKQGIKGHIRLEELKRPGLNQIKNVDPSEMTEIADILRKHGALDQLPDFSVIRVTRPGFSEPAVILRENTNGWNHFTLLEMLLQSYPVQAGFFPFAPPASQWAFPDLARLIIHRPSRKPDGKEQQMEINVLNATNGVDCSKDIPLEFGDVIEIPVREHPLNKPPVGLTIQQGKTIVSCLERRVRITVRNQTRDLTLKPNGEDPGVGCFYLNGALRFPDAQSLLLSSSDLSRVKVTRKDPATGKTTEFVVDVPKVRNTPQDLFLRDGDVIEVPEK